MLSKVLILPLPPPFLDFLSTKLNVDTLRGINQFRFQKAFEIGFPGKNRFQSIIFSLFLVGDGTDGKLSNAEGGDKNNDEEQAAGIGILETMLDNLDQFVLEPSPQGCVVKCRITRDRKGMDRGMYGLGHSLEYS